MALNKQKKTKVVITLKLKVPDERRTVTLEKKLEIERNKNESFEDFVIRVIKERITENPSRRTSKLAEEFAEEFRKEKLKRSNEK